MLCQNPPCGITRELASPTFPYALLPGCIIFCFSRVVQDVQNDCKEALLYRRNDEVDALAELC